MITHDTLRDAAFTLPKPLRDRYFEERKAIRARIAISRITYEPRRLVYVSWDDPEFVAKCAVLIAVLIAELQLEAQAAVNRLFGG